MTVNPLTLNSVLVVKLQTGLTPKGGPVFRQKGLNDVDANTTEQAAYDVAAALFSLGKNPVANVFLRKNFELIDE